MISTHEGPKAYRFYPYFFEPCLKKFSFLVADHSFSSPQLEVVAQEGYVNFRKLYHGFLIGHEPPYQVWGTVVKYKNNHSSRTVHSLGFHQIADLLEDTHYSEMFKKHKAIQSQKRGWLNTLFKDSSERHEDLVAQQVQELAVFLRENYQEVLDCLERV